MAELYVVATPIGNLSDLTPRMKEALERCDLIAAEDTRVTLKLLNHLGVKKPMVSYHQHNEDRRAEELVGRMLSENLTVALTCDAGTPAISDPGVPIVRAAWRAGIRVIPVCGPSAVTSALSVSGFDARAFAFYGFLPRDKKHLREKFGDIHKSGIPVAIVYESPHRVVKLVEEMKDAWPECRLCVCSDISKLYEKILVGGCAEVYEALKANPNVEKGEYCIVADISALPAYKEETKELSAELYIASKLLEGMDMEEAALDASESGYARNDIYKAKLNIREKFMVCKNC